MYSFRLRSSSSSVPPTSSISPARVRFPRRFSGDDGISGVVSGEICARLVLVFLFALGKDLLCSPVSSLFWAGVAVAGRGLPGGLLLRFGGGGAIFVSGGLARHLLETASPSSPSVRSLMVFQRLKSILMGGLGWWFLQLNHAMGSDDGGLGGCCFDSGPSVGGSKLMLLTSWPVRLRKMNRSFRNSFVIFFLFGVLVVKRELYYSMF